ncbi:MAG: sigma-54 dependent transcriptional regulator [Verrucomicrobiota bacterium]
MSSPQVPPNLLLVDDDESIRNLLSMAARSRGWQPVAAGSGAEGCQLLTAEIKAVVLDHGLPDGDGIQVLERLRKRRPEVAVIMLTGHNDAETAVRALRAGADDYLTKPFELDRLFGVILKACRLRRQNSNAQVFDATTAARKHGGLLKKNHSPRMRELFEQMQKAAQLDVTLLLTGESGTGKTFVAREIHHLSTRTAEPFIPVSCPALPRELLESELFGHERGAFTGATATREGRFEQATRGTIFLDEIGDLPGELQPKLLTVLQDQEFFRVGGNRILRTDARIIAATNIDLLARVRDGRFREDLYYRLNVLELHLPPLRERLEDLPDITSSILDRIALKRAKDPWTITTAAVQALASYPWPGNIRQLENILERATAFANGSQLDEQDILPLLEVRSAAPTAEINSPRSLQEVERQAFVDAYLRNGRNKARTSRELGIAERTVYNLLARYDIK